MRIAALQDHLRTGGTEAQFLDLTRRWAQAGHAVTRIVFRRGGGLAAADDDGTESIFLQPVSSPWNWWAPGLKRCLRRIRPDRVICFGRNAHWSLARTLDPGAKPGLAATLRGGRPLPAGYRRLLGEADRVVANSGYARDRGLGAGVAGEKLRVIENGCRLAERRLPGRIATRNESGATEDETVLLCLGSFVPGKAQERLLSVWENLAPDVRRSMRLWFVGEGPRRRCLERRAKSLGNGDRIRFWGNRPDPETFFAAADAAVSVSREESFPNALLEALWFGVPVLATACAGVGEMIGEGRDGWVFPDSAEGEKDLAQAIARLARGGRAALGLAGAVGQDARHRFDPSARAADYLALFHEMGDFRLG